jgi:hypothetical protein
MYLDHFNSELSRDEERDILHALHTPTGLNIQVKKFKISEVMSMINLLRLTKAPGYDLTAGRILKDLPEIRIKAITVIFNSILRTGYFSGEWNVSQTIPLLKPGKPTEEVTSYRPAEEVTSYRPAEEVTSYRPTEEVTSYRPTEEVTSYRPTEEVTSYIPISLLLILSKLFEKIFSTITQPILHDKLIYITHTEFQHVCF